jgi:hypothetical protein
MAEWLQRAGDMCEALDLTLIGVVHSAKQREGQRITDPRYSITGSVATGGFTSCQIIVETPDAVKAPDKRKVWIYPRNAKQRCFDMEMNSQGILVPDSQLESDRLCYLEESVLAEAERPLALGEIARVMQGRVGTSRSTTQRYLAQLVSEGRVDKFAHGMYALRRATAGEAQPEGLPWE